MRCTQETISDETHLLGMISEMAGDIILRTNRDGFIISATSGLDALGVDLSEMLINPHLADLTKGSHALAVRDYHSLALASKAGAGMISFPTIAEPTVGLDAESWYSLKLRPTPDRAGTLGVMRSLKQERALEQKLVSTVLTDQVTGLPNCTALHMLLSDALICGLDGSLVMIEIDHFRAITLRFGQSMGEEVIAAVAQFLTHVNRSGATIARMEGERFVIFLPAIDLMHALAWTQDMITTFAAISNELAFEHTKLTLSAGVARLAGTVDSALSRGELGVSVAKASGGSRTECGDWLHGRENAEKIAPAVQFGGCALTG